MSDEAPNICGECRACCTVLGVAALEKDENTTCKHECAAGCAIYKSRPQECSVYECFYHRSHPNFSDNFRPDKLGVIIEINESGGHKAIFAREIEKGNYEKSGLARQFVEYLSLSEEAFIVVTFGTEFRTIFPPWVAHLEGKINVRVLGWRDIPKDEPNDRSREVSGV